MKSKPLSEIARAKQWRNLPISQLTSSGFPVYGANGVIGYYNEYNHEHPTIAITCRGATCGNIHITQPKSYVTSNAMSLDDLDTTECDIKYLALYLMHRGLQDVTTGAAQPQITRGNLEKVEIPLPPLDDQKRIAYLLSKVEGLITQRKQHLQQLDDLLKSVFLELFGDPIANQRGFAQRTLGTVLTVKHGFAFKSEYFTDEGEYVLLTPGNFREEGGFRDRAERQKFYSGDIPKGYLLNKDDLLIAMTEQAPGLLGSPLLVPAANRFLHNQRLGLIELKEPAEKLYLFHLFNHHSIRQIIHSKATGMKVRHTSPTKIEDISVAYPPLGQQETFAGICRVCKQVEGVYRQTLGEFESLFSALSQKAFKGELDLSRVHLPAIADVNAEIETKELLEASTDGSTFELPTPANLNDLADTKGRKIVVNQWMDAYLKRLGTQPFSTEAFIHIVQQKLSDLQSAGDAADIDYEFSAADYDHVKDWIFQNMETKRLTQHYDDANNQVQISLAKD